jgi:tetratricopeptide (TPR) repeat protein
MNVNRITRRQALAAGLGTVIAGHVAAVAVQKSDEEKSWIGRVVLPRRYAPTAWHRPANSPKVPDGKPLELPVVLSSASHAIRGEEGSRVELFDGDNHFCWIAKDELLPLDEAEAFFSKALAAAERDFFALTSRGWAYYLSGKLDRAIADYDAHLKTAPAAPAGALERWEVLVNRGLILAEQGEFARALADLDEAVKAARRVDLALANRGFTYELIGDYEKAFVNYHASNGVLGRNNFAWLLATCPVEKFRDAKSAVHLATQVCEASESREGMFLDTLAAAHASAGRFDDAVKAQVKALEDPAFTPRYGEGARKRLKLYQDKKPYRSEPVKKK